MSRPRHVTPGLWGEWDIEMLVSLCAARRDPLRPFADHLLDLKFKLYCLLEVDLPAYAAAIRRWGLEPGDAAATPQGFAARLSEEVTLIIKSRAVWESVMNAVCWYATGRQARTVKATAASGASFASKTRTFFPWVATQPQWASLATFKPGHLTEPLRPRGMRLTGPHPRSSITSSIVPDWPPGDPGSRSHAVLNHSVRL